MKGVLSVILLCCFVTASVARIPVYVMLPLNTITKDGLQNPSQLLKDFQKLQSGGVAGVMIDVWWGLVETSPKSYQWSSYDELCDLVERANLKLQTVMSFHRCGGNVGDDCDIPLPWWVRSVGSSNPDIYYTDREGHRDEEYLSLGVDEQPLFDGRTAVQLYGDFMQAFTDHFGRRIGGTIDGVMIGLGPASELRYPSYQLDRWSYCGVGEFQCYDKYMLADLKTAASAVGHSEWGNGGPSNAGGYNSRPYDTDFFTDNKWNNYASEYGNFFLGWYSEKLLGHGENVLQAAKAVFGNKVPIGAKVSGIHWWYGSSSHAAELTAGYYNSNGNNAYRIIAQMVRNYADIFDFTCMEMTDSSSCSSMPVELVAQSINAAHSAGLQWDGENAIELCNPDCYKGGFDQIYWQATRSGTIQHFTYLRLTRNLLDNSNNWHIFSDFVSKMNSA